MELKKQEGNYLLKVVEKFLFDTYLYTSFPNLFKERI